MKLCRGPCGTDGPRFMQRLENIHCLTATHIEGCSAVTHICAVRWLVIARQTCHIGQPIFVPKKVIITPGVKCNIDSGGLTEQCWLPAADSLYLCGLCLSNLCIVPIHTYLRLGCFAFQNIFTADQAGFHQQWIQNYSRSFN